MNITMNDINTNKVFTLTMVGDWAIYARAVSAMIGDSTLTEDEAIRMAVEEEDDDFRHAMDVIKSGHPEKADAVIMFTDGTFVLEDDFYTDAHMAEISEAVEEALASAEEDTYEAEKEASWWNR